eukprot:jgi/Bigna1/89313/estExt_fgenesh1_pg.C_470017
MEKSVVDAVKGLWKAATQQQLGLGGGDEKHAMVDSKDMLGKVIDKEAFVNVSSPSSYIDDKATNFGSQIACPTVWTDLHVHITKAMAIESPFLLGDATLLANAEWHAEYGKMKSITFEKFSEYMQQYALQVDSKLRVGPGLFLTYLCDAILEVNTTSTSTGNSVVKTGEEEGKDTLLSLQPPRLVLRALDNVSNVLIKIREEADGSSPDHHKPPSLAEQPNWRDLVANDDGNDEYVGPTTQSSPKGSTTTSSSHDASRTLAFGISKMRISKPSPKVREGGGGGNRKNTRTPKSTAADNGIASTEEGEGQHELEQQEATAEGARRRDEEAGRSIAHLTLSNLGIPPQTEQQILSERRAASSNTTTRQLLDGRGGSQSARRVSPAKRQQEQAAHRRSVQQRQHHRTSTNATKGGGWRYGGIEESGSGLFHLGSQEQEAESHEADSYLRRQWHGLVDDDLEMDVPDIGAVGNTPRERELFSERSSVFVKSEKIKQMMNTSPPSSCFPKWSARGGERGIPAHIRLKLGHKGGPKNRSCLVITSKPVTERTYTDSSSSNIKNQPLQRRAAAMMATKGAFREDHDMYFSGTSTMAAEQAIPSAVLMGVERGEEAIRRRQRGGSVNNLSRLSVELPSEHHFRPREAPNIGELHIAVQLRKRRDSNSHTNPFEIRKSWVVNSSRKAPKKALQARQMSSATLCFGQLKRPATTNSTKRPVGKSFSARLMDGSLSTKKSLTKAKRSQRQKKMIKKAKSDFFNSSVAASKRGGGGWRGRGGGRKGQHHTRKNSSSRSNKTRREAGEPSSARRRIPSPSPSRAISERKSSTSGVSDSIASSPRKRFQASTSKFPAGYRGSYRQKLGGSCSSSNGSLETKKRFISEVTRKKAAARERERKKVFLDLSAATPRSKDPALYRPMTSRSRKSSGAAATNVKRFSSARTVTTTLNTNHDSEPRRKAWD